MLAFVFNGPQLHLLVNHIPVIGLPIAMAALLYGLLRKSDAVLAFALLLVVACALGAGAARLTGEEAEEVVEELVEDDYIEQHEDAGKVAFLASALLGVLALAGLVMGRKGKPVPRPLVLVTLVAGLAVSGYLGYTAHLGGLIRHTEIRDGATGVQALDGDDDPDDDSGRGRGRGRGGDDR